MGNPTIASVLATLVISMMIQAVFFAYAAWKKTDKVTDLSYGMTFILIATYLFLANITCSLIQLIIFWAIVIWGGRLSFYLFNRIMKIKKDRRFDGIRENFFKFAGFWFFQGITVWLVMLPHSMVLSSSENKSFGLLAWLGVIIWATGLAIETVADRQKFNFKNNPKNKDQWVDTGLWRYSRHPNYFGEITLWWGLFLVALPYLNGWKLLGIIGPLFITFILLFVSGIPPLEKRYDHKYAGNKKYKEYKKKTSLLIPLPPLQRLSKTVD